MKLSLFDAWRMDLDMETLRRFLACPVSRYRVILPRR